MHEQTNLPDLRDQELAGLQETLKRRDSLTIWFDPEMTWQASPSGKRGGRQTCSDAATQTCLSI